MVVEDLVLGSIETGFAHFGRNSIADGVRHPLAERTSGCFDSGCFMKFRVAGRHAVELPEVPQLVDRQSIAGKMQPAVKEHAAMAGRKNEPVTVDPARIVGIVFQGMPVENRTDLGGSQR